MRALEFAVRGVVLLAGIGAFAYTAVRPVSTMQAGAGGAALILGLYLGFTPWSTLKRLARFRSPGGHQ